MTTPHASVKDIFDQAAELASREEQQAYLDRACAGEIDVRSEVESLLRALEQAGDFLGTQPNFTFTQNTPSLDDQTIAVSSTSHDTVPSHRDEIPDFLQPSSNPGSLGRLDHYEILNVIGRGGMSTVLKALDEKLHRMVAIKVLAAELAVNPTSRKRFIREAQAAAAVCDEHLVTIYSVEEEHRPPYLVMQFIDGRSLQDLIDHEGPLALPDILRIGKQVAKGLAAAHKQGLIHRDIKPSNILLSGDSVKITDFGLARVSEGDSHLTQTGQVAGTPMYMSPEQAEGKTVDCRSDLFSLGSVLYALCTGRTPFHGNNTMAIMRRVCEDTPAPVKEFNPTVPDWLIELIQKLHAKNPDGRGNSATEVAELLEQQLQSLDRTAAITSNQHDVPTDTAETLPFDSDRSARPVPQTLAVKPRRRWLAMAASLLFVVTAVLAAPGVFRFITSDGTLIVEIEDPGVSVSMNDGELVVTGAGAKEMKFKPGQHKLQASKDGKVFKQELVNVERGGKQIVKIFLAPKEAEAANSPVPIPVVVPATWFKAVAAMPAIEQVKAVAAKLKELNPKFDGKVEHKIENDVVVELGFGTAEVTDIAPVRALLGLRKLRLEGEQGSTPTTWGKLSDLRPLKGLALTSLSIGGNQVADLTPLKEMPLLVLHCYRNPIKDLAPLATLPLRYLDCGSTQVADLTSVARLPLQRLIFPQCRVSNLAPLSGLRLTDLNFAGNPVSDVSVLKHLSLSQLWMDVRPWQDLEWLKDIKTLTSINNKTVAEVHKEQAAARAEFEKWAATVAKMKPDDQVQAVAEKLKLLNPGFDGKVKNYTATDRAVTVFHFVSDQVADLSPVRALVGLEMLHCFSSSKSSKLNDLSPLRGMNLRGLYASNSRIHDLTPLARMPLERLSVSNTNVADLSPVRDCPLVAVRVEMTKVIDLSPLRGKPIHTLSFNGCKMSDLSVLNTLALKDLILDVHLWRDAERLRSIKTLQKINDTPVSEFWKEQDTLKAAFESWCADVAKMTPEEQVKAVAAELQKRNRRFDGKVELRKIEKDAGLELEFLTDAVTDLSPVRAIPGLTSLRIRGTTPAKGDSTQRGILNDLSPLVGLRLTSLDCGFNPITDLSPLKGMPLIRFDYRSTGVTDLAPVAAAPLEEVHCTYHAERDALLRGIPSVRSINGKTTADFWKEVEAR